MLARRTTIQLAAKAGLLFGAFFLLSVLLAAMPGHRTPNTPQDSAQEVDHPAPAQGVEHGSMPGMDMSDENASEAHAVQAMTAGHHDAHSLHMRMTGKRQETPDDVARAKEIVAELRAGIEKYRDYHVALNEGYKIFLPNLPLPEYHFTSYRNGFLEAFTFDPSRPTSLLYKKTSTGYELVGAMYTMPKGASEDQLNARVPLSVASWHLHTNLCLPPKDQFRSVNWNQFGLKGAIATQQACDDAGGRFQPVIFGWMVHVYPFENSLEKIFAMHHHMD
jgi:hypothetical protein